jgi:DNA-binding NarL/FixJ family response regulator
MSDAVAVVRDLVFSSKIIGTGRALGVDVQAVTALDALEGVLAEGEVRLVIVDMSLPEGLATQSLQRAAAHPSAPERLAFYSHVHAELAEAAEAAGATMMMHRSTFSAELPDVLKRFGPRSS